MSLKRLVEIDANLLVLLAVLIETGSVAETSRRLKKSESATSHALARLRDVFGDPLFVRAGSRLAPTATTLALRDALSVHLRGLEGVLTSSLPFTPKKSVRAFIIAADDYFTHVVFPGLARSAWADAPGVTFHLRASDLAHDDRRWAQLGEGQLDLVVAPVAPTTNQVRRQILLRDDYVCLVPPDHGARGRALTLAELVDLPHVVVGLGRPGPTLLDDALAEKGHERRVVARVSDFGAAGVVASALRLLWTVPRRLGEALAPVYGLARAELPFALREVAISMLWHERQHEDPAHAWLRKRLIAAANAAK